MLAVFTGILFSLLCLSRSVALYQGVHLELSFLFGGGWEGEEVVYSHSHLCWGKGGWGGGEMEEERIVAVFFFPLYWVGEEGGCSHLWGPGGVEEERIIAVFFYLGGGGVVAVFVGEEERVVDLFVNLLGGGGGEGCSSFCKFIGGEGGRVVALFVNLLGGGVVALFVNLLGGGEGVVSLFFFFPSFLLWGVGGGGGCSCFCLGGRRGNGL